MSWGDRDKAPVSEVAELLRSASFGMFGLNHFETKIQIFWTQRYQCQLYGKNRESEEDNNGVDIFDAIEHYIISSHKLNGWVVDSFSSHSVYTNYLGMCYGLLCHFKKSVLVPIIIWNSISLHVNVIGISIFEST